MKNADKVIKAILICIGMAFLIGCANPVSNDTSTKYSNNGGTMTFTFIVNGVDTVKTFNFNLNGVSCTKSSGASTSYTIEGFENGTGNSGGKIVFTYTATPTIQAEIVYTLDISNTKTLTSTASSVTTAPTLPVNVNDQFSITNTPGSALNMNASIGYLNPGYTLKSYSISARLK